MTDKNTDKTDKNNKRLCFTALGGAGEIGMNMYLYAYGTKGKERFILVDVGVAFPSFDGQPGVDLIVADFNYIAERADRLDGIFITHGHEDHLGALPALAPILRAPIYARRFTATLAKLKLDSKDNKWLGQGKKPQVREVKPYPNVVEAGPFKVSFLPISHSIPESSGLLIETPNERVIHSGDFKIDRTPVLGDGFNDEMFKEVAKDGVDALVCDSTNVFSNHAGRSEASLAPAFDKLLAGENGLVVATTFASNVARLKTLAQAAVRAGRTVVVMGHSMRRMLGAAREVRLLDDFPPVFEWDEVKAKGLARNKMMVLVTGSQGERRAGSAKLASGGNLGLAMSKGDLFIFSSKTIPGNETEVGRIINLLLEQGVRVIDDSTDAYHVSGHANAPDLQAFHKMINPRMVIPMHGEYGHLLEHKELAERGGIASIVAPNGTTVDLSADKPTVVGEIKTGMTYLDGNRLIPAYAGVISERMKLAERGLVMVFIGVEGGEVIDIWAEPVGLPMDGEELGEQIEEAVLADFKGQRVAKMDDDRIKQVVKFAAGRVCFASVGKKPTLRILLSRD